MSTTDNNSGADETDSTTYSEESIPPEDEEQRIEDILGEISPEAFTDWYQEQEYADNIREGKPYFNSPGYIAPEQKHNPSKFLQCHRKVSYKNQNTPSENGDPNGIFFFGNQFEEEVALPFLDDIANDIDGNNYVRQDMYINHEVTVDGVDLLVKGETDPVITDREGAPLVITEIKTARSVDSKKGPDGGPSRRHKAQIHAYMAGLNEEYDRDIDKGLIIYGARQTFDMAVCEVEFDEEFWKETVLDWAQTQTEYRIDEELPPADPEEPSWECQYCDYQNRCGENDDNDWEDIGTDGFVPLLEYPESPAEDYLRSERENGMKLTPTLAHQHPEIADEYEVFDWVCDYCTSTYDWDHFDWDGDNLNPPSCPNCKDEHGNLPLRGPLPENQLSK